MERFQTPVPDHPANMHIRSTPAEREVTTADYRVNWSVSEAAERIGISVSKAYQMALSGDLPHLRIGRRVLVPVAALERWIEAHTQGGRV